MKKILITGSEGMLGEALIHSLTSRHLAVEGVDIRSRENTASITNIDDIIELMNRIKPDIVIHAAAWTDVDGCELNPGNAYLVNGQGTKNVAEACKKAGAFLIYMSTDFVFDGTKTTPYTEEDKPNPVNVYGQSKLKGEDFIRKIMENFLIIRTSWLFGQGGRNFVDAIVTKAETEKRLKVVDDQLGSPTYSVDLAGAMGELLLRTTNYELRTLNITNSSSCSRFDFAKEIIKVKGIKGVTIEPIKSEELDLPAKRPKMSILDNTRFKGIYRRELPAWQDALRRYIKR